MIKKEYEKMVSASFIRSALTVGLAILFMALLFVFASLIDIVGLQACFYYYFFHREPNTDMFFLANFFFSFFFSSFSPFFFPFFFFSPLFIPSFPYRFLSPRIGGGQK